MLGFGWLTLRQAQEALKNGRLEEAQRLLSQPSIAGHRRTGALLVQLTRSYAERGERQLRLDDVEGAWRDLLAAEGLGTAEKGCDRLRQALTGLGMAEVRALLQAGETGRAEEAVARLRQRGARSAELQVLEEALRGWLAARALADRGELGPAAEAAERARRLLGANHRLEEFHADLQRRRGDFVRLLGQLHEAADAGRWREVIETAEQVLAAAPQHAEARALRTRAWKALEPVTVAMGSPGPAQTEAAPEGLAPRYLLWIDGVGGYLVCLGARLTFGQAARDPRTDVPLIADVSRLHATLTRDAEGYLLEAVRPIQVNGQSATRILLQAGDRVTLGSTCQFLFRLPVPGSTTARLDLVSGHRLPLAVDGVLLMADTLVLGAGPAAHVTVPDLKQPVILFRHKRDGADGLGLRYSGALRINGEVGGSAPAAIATHSGAPRSNGEAGPRRTLLEPRATVSGEDLAFAIEPANWKG
jgi:hypothetical protein